MLKTKKCILIALIIAFVLLASVYMNRSVEIGSIGGLLDGDISAMLVNTDSDDANWINDWYQYDLRGMTGFLNDYCDRVKFEYQADLYSGGVRVMLYNQKMECIYDETFMGPCKVEISRDMTPDEPFGVRLLFKNGTTGFGLSTKCTEYVKRWRTVINKDQRSREETSRLQADFGLRFLEEFDPYYGNDIKLP